MNDSEYVSIMLKLMWVVGDNIGSQIQQVHASNKCWQRKCQ